MAKLPELQRREVGLPTPAGPGEALARANQIRGITDTLSRTAFQLAEINTEFKKADAKVDAMNEVSAFEQFHAGKEVYTREELDEMGVGDRVSMIDPDGVEREAVPRHEVYPILLEEQLTRSIEAHAGDIRNPQARKEWLLDMEAARAKAVDQAVIQAKEQAVEYTFNQRVQKIDTAQRAGNYAGAALLIEQTYTDPAAKQKALAENEKAQADYGYNLLIMNGTEAQLRSAAETLRATKLSDTPYDSDEQKAMAAELERAADNRETDANRDQVKLEKRTRGAAIAAMAERVNNGEPLSWQKDFAPVLANAWAQDSAFVSSWNTLYSNYNKSQGTSIHPKDSTPKVLAEFRRRIDDPSENPVQLYQDLQNAVGELDAADWSNLDQLLMDRSDPAKQSGLQTVAQQVDMHLMTLNIDPAQTDKDDEALQVEASFRRAVDQSIRRAVEANGGKPLDDTQTKAAVDRVFFDVQKREVGHWYLWDRGGAGDNVFQTIQDAEGDNYANAIRAMEVRMAKDPRTRYTADEYWAAYLWYRENR